MVEHVTKREEKLDVMSVMAIAAAGYNLQGEFNPNYSAEASDKHAAAFRHRLQMSRAARNIKSS